MKLVFVENARWGKSNLLRLCLTLVFLIGTGLSGCSSDSSDPNEPVDQADLPDPDSTEPIECRDLSAKRAPRPAGDLYVTKTGDDANDGQSYETSFATIQKGVDALEAGQTLIIGPGEYLESVHRGTFIQWEYANGLGSPDMDTIIRAEIPGTVVLRGDAPAPAFRKLDGYRYVWEADVEPGIDIHVVNELDTLEVLPKKVDINGLDYLPGAFVHKKEAGKLYISSSDFKPADEHRYSLSLIQDHGFALVDATRVIVDGLTVTGFNMSEPIFAWNDFTSFSVWGIFVTHSRNCEIRNSRTYLNARGIGITDGNAADGEYGGNIVDGCVSWANESPIATEDTGGITMTNPRGDEVRNSLTYLNGGLGINIYGEAEDATGERFELANNMAWGNEYADYKIKGNDYYAVTNSIGLNGFSHSTRPQHCLIGGEVNDAQPDSIVLASESDLDPRAEFADPENHDFRLQSTSRFRAESGEDRGPHPFEANVFFIAPNGVDSGDGLSVSSAWKTFNHATKNLKAGDTLYVSSGDYTEDVVWSLKGTKDAPINIRGRGESQPRILGQWNVHESQAIELKRLSFAKTLRITDSDALVVDNCFLNAPDRGLWAANTVALQVTQSTFNGFEKAAIELPCSVDSHIAGNLFNNTQGPALLVPDDSAVRYGNYNSYSNNDAAWLVGTTPEPFATVQATREPQSQQLVPEFLIQEGQPPQLENHLDFAFGGLFGMPFGPSRPVMPKTSIRVVETPQVHSVSATTANFTWTTAVPVQADISWGDTQAMTNSIEYLARPFATMSLTELEPNTTYYFRVNSFAIPEGVDVDAEPITFEDTLTFTTAATDPESKTYFVSTTGDDSNDGLASGSAWLTLQHAADQVAVGDTVLIAGGQYSEEVYIKATGSPGRPITFRNIPGERVELHGVMAALSNAFVIAGKTHLDFDGLYFTEYGDSNRWTSGFLPLVGADFNIYESSDITISRSFFYGYSFQLNGIMAHQVDSLSLDNVVFMNHFQALYMYYVSNLLVEHSVIARPWLFASILYNLLPERPAHFNQTIFTDNFKSKADQNLHFFYGDSGVQTQCVYSLRDEHDPTWRKLDSESTAFEAPDRYIDPVFADPQFAGVETLIAAGEDITFSADGVMSENFVPNFDSFYATNPAVTSLEIGLEPTRFDANGTPN